MIWRRLVSTLVRNDTPSTAAAFLDALIAAGHSLTPERDPADRSDWLPHITKPIAELRIAARQAEQPPPARAERWWSDLRRGLLARFPEADSLALHWFLNYAGRQEKVVETATRLGLKDRYYLDPSDMIQYWVEHHPAAGAADTIAAALRDHLMRLGGDLALVHDYDTEMRAEYAINALVDVLAILERAEQGQLYARGHALAMEAVRTGRANRLASVARGGAYPLGSGVITHPGGGSSTFVKACGFASLSRHVVNTFFPPLMQADRLSEDEVSEVLAENPVLLLNEKVRLAALPATTGQKLAAVIEGYLARALAGEQDPTVWQVLDYYRDYAGIDHFLAAARYIEGYLAAHPKQKLPINHQVYSSAGHPLGWATFLLRKLLVPTTADWARAGELTELKPATLLAAALYSPPWTDLIEGQLGWPGLGALARWLRRHGGPSPWSAYRPPSSAQDEEDPGVVDRAAALEAAMAMGEERVRQLLKHHVARGLYPDALYSLQALLGWNAAEIEAGFLKRNKQAVRALGMLPDEDDICERYLALRRFAKEAKQFGAQRQASEVLAAESGLANLARTAGYEDLAQLEWAMEAQIGQEVDPSRAWTVGDYTVTLEPSPAATLLVSRGGKRLKSVPAAVRNDPVYVEIKEARELLTAQFERVRRRLKVAMTLGEVIDRAGFAPGLMTPAGRTMVPALVLRLWLAGAAEPVEALAFRTLAGEEVALDEIERIGIAHPLHLIQTGSLRAWGRRLIEKGYVQPFNQLFREVYTLAAGEREERDSQYLAGRRVRLGAFMERLKRHGWRRGDEGDVVRPCRGGLEASLWFADGAAYSPASEVLTIERLHFYGPGFTGIGSLDALLFSEVMRELDLASTTAAPDRATAPVSPEVIAARAALVQAIVPAATTEGEMAGIGGRTLHLGTGAMYGPDGAAVAAPALPAPIGFPYPEPIMGTAEVVARARHLAGVEGDRQ